MVDFQSRFRMYGHGYTSPVQKYPVATHRELYHDTAPRCFKTRPTAHDCRREVMQDNTASTEWETWLLSHGLAATYRGVEEMHDKDAGQDTRDTPGRSKPPDKLIFTVCVRGKTDGAFTYLTLFRQALIFTVGVRGKADGDFTYLEPGETPSNSASHQAPDYLQMPDKLIFTVGVRGKTDGDFTYPRGLCVNMDGDILVADTGNHRVQTFSNFGVFKSKMGRQGRGKGEFDEPTGVAELTNGDIAVADKNNKRIQVFDSQCQYKYEFATGYNPYSIAGDTNYNIVVGTTNRTIEVYRRGGKLQHKFSLGVRDKGRTGFQIALNDRDEVVVCDAADGMVKFYTYAGKLLYKFSPTSNAEGLATIPCGITRTPLDQYLVSDSLNHTVCLYTERGVLLQQVLCPTDDAGAIQACALGPEGHFLACEYTVTGSHCMKIFRYRSCTCHASRPNSSKRRTPTPLV